MAMSIDIPNLVLSSFPQKDKRLLVRAADAIRLCRDGSYETLSRHESSHALMMRQPTEAREFVAKAGVLSRTLSDCPDLPLLAELRALIAGGTLVAVRECGDKPSAATPSLVKQRRVLGALATAKPEAMRFKGGIYWLLTDADFKRIQELDDYTVVTRADAVEVLTGLAESASSARASLFMEAADLLTQDWRPPLSPDGLILLKRRFVVRTAQHSAGPAEKARQPGAGTQSAAPEEETEPKRPCPVALSAASENGTPFCDACTHP
jgi:hypothetical protein